MSIQYLSPYIVGRSNNVKVVLDLNGYLRKDGKTLVKKEDLDYLLGKNYFGGDDGAQNYLVFRVKKNILNNSFLTALLVLVFTIKYGDQMKIQMKYLVILKRKK